MPEPIVEVQVTTSPDKLRLEWAIPIEDGQWVWEHDLLEVRLYCRNYPDFGKPTLLDMDLDTTTTTYTSSGTFRIPFLDVTIGKEKSRGSFRAGTVAADPTGKFYPLYFELRDAEIPAGGSHCYPVVEWPVSGDWLAEPRTIWVVFGYTRRGEFIPVHEAEPYEHRVDDKLADTRLPEVDVPSVPADKRIRRRGATPKLFVSYSHADQGYVHDIVKRLSEEFYYDVWIDYDSIPGGTQWREQIARGIAAAKRVLFMLSPTAVASRWCREEVRYAIEMGKTVIPVRINGTCGQDDLAAVGLSGTHYRDFSSAAKEWDQLLADLPEVMPRNQRWNDRAFRERHTDYLRSLFHRYSRVNLTYLLDAMPKEEVSLLDVYVPLFMGLNIWGRVEKDELVDWWVWQTDKDGRRRPTHADTGHGEDRPKRLPDVQVDAGIMALIVERVHEFVGELASRERGIEDGEYPLWRFESEAVPALQPHLVITGDPGSGKSTLMKHLALCMAGDQLYEATNEVERRADLDLLGFWPHPAYTPVFIELRDLMSKALRDPRAEVTLQRLNDYLCDEQLAPAGCANYLDDLRSQMRDGDVMFFLDGLDEIPGADTRERREQVKALTSLLRDNFPQCRILVTARPYAYANGQLDGFGQVSLAPLDADRLEELALKLFTQVLGADKAEEQAPQFKQQMEEHVPEELRRSPLFFTLLAAIWLNNQVMPTETRLPVTPGAIYRECVDMLIRRWTRKDLRTGESMAEAIGLDEPQLRELLERLAYRGHRQSSGDAELGFESGRIMTVLRTDMNVRGIDHDLLLDALAQRAGVIYERAPGEFTFAHRSFQEHLSAAYWAYPGHYPGVAAGDLIDRPGLWRNVFELFPDEAVRQKLDLWALVERLLPEDAGALPAQADDQGWWQFYFATRLMTDGIPAGDRQQQLFRPLLRHALAKMIGVGALPPKERAEMGRTLAELDDPRPGVLAPGGIPDIDWVEIPAGEFLMGSDKDRDPLASDAETPQHTAFLDTFSISRFPITFAQYEAFVNDGGYAVDAYWTDEGLKWRGDKQQPEFHWNVPKWHMVNHPLLGVTWYEAYAFTQWLSAKLSCDVRLATEAQWEKAARGANGRIYPYGGEFDPNKGNTAETDIDRTTAVGLFPAGASSYGVLDMSGNVWEWSLTKWRDSYTEPEDNNPQGDALRVVRGGLWGLDQHRARAAYRSGSNPYFLNYSVGFRVVRVPHL